MAENEPTRNNGTGPEDQPRTGLEIIAAQNGEGNNGHHPLDVVTAVIGLTQEVNKASTRRAIEIAKGMGLTKIDELDQLVEASGRVQVIDSPNGHHETVAVPVEIEDRTGDEAVSTEGVTSEQESEEKEPSSTAEPDKSEKTERQPSNGEKYSDQFNDLPTYKLRKGQLSQANIVHNAIVQFLDKKYAEGDPVEIKPSTGDNGSALSALIRLMKEDPDIEANFDEINVVAKHDAFRRLAACGYLDVDTIGSGNGERQYRRIVAVRLGTPSAEDLKKN